MTCVHLKEIYQLVEKHEIKLGSSDLIRMKACETGMFTLQMDAIRKVKAGETVRLSGSISDPDGDDVSVKWWQYVEAGSWSASSSSGYNSGGYRFTLSATTESATAAFNPNFSASGFYPVYIWYRASSNRPKDALYRPGLRQVIECG